MSFRHSTKILTHLAGLDFDENKEKIARGRLVIFVFSKALSKEDDQSLKAVRAGSGEKKSRSRGVIPRGSFVRMASINLRLLRERDASRMDDALDEYVRINLYRIVRNVAGLTRGPS